MDILRHIAQTGTAVIMSTHNMPLLEEFPGIVYRCVDGHIEEMTSNYNKMQLEEDLEEEEDSKDESNDEPIMILES
jgi:cell division transport system ATP-binding protein